MFRRVTRVLRLAWIVVAATLVVAALALWLASAGREISIKRYKIRSATPARTGDWGSEDTHILYAGVTAGRLVVGIRDLSAYFAPRDLGRYRPDAFYQWRVVPVASSSWDIWRWRYSREPGRWQFAGVSIYEMRRTNPLESQLDVRVPLYLLALAFGIPALLMEIAVRRRHRRKWAEAGRCVRCGYDLRSSKDRCPECGTTVPKPESKGPSEETKTSAVSITP